MCKYCGSRDFISLNNDESYDCSGMDIAISNLGCLRARAFYGERWAEFESTVGIVNIKYCPMCGRRLM